MAASPAKSASLELSGVQKAAILVMYLDRDAAKALLQNLSDDEVKRIGIAIAGLKQIDEGVIEAVVGDFVDQLKSVCLLPATGPDFARKILPTLVNEERRERVSTAVRRRTDNDFEQVVRGCPANAVAAVLAEEHPQVRAVALLRMGAENAARVLACFPEEEQSDLTIRMTRAEKVAAELAEDVEKALRASLADIEDPMPLGGVETTARILGRMSREKNATVLGNVRATAEDLADDLQRRMVSFEDLGRLDNRAIQAVLRVVERADLVSALKGAESALRDRFLANLSSRAAQDLLEEIEIGGRVRRSVMKEAQDRIVAAARQLAEEGTIFLDVGEAEEAAG